MKNLMLRALLALALVLPASVPAQIVNPAFIQSGAGAVARTFLSKARDAINVKDFGAIGNGIADDTANFQKAIDATPAGARIEARGTFYTSGTLYLRKSNVDYDFRGARFTGMGTVAVGDIDNPTVMPQNITLIGGEYAPAATADVYPAASRNPVTVVIGTNITIINPRIFPKQGARAISIQTDTGWGVAPFENLRNVRVYGLNVIGDGNCVDGVDVTSAGAYQYMIADVSVQGVVDGCKRGFNVATNGDAYYSSAIDLQLRVRSPSVASGVYKAVRSGTVDVSIEGATAGGVTVRNIDDTRVDLVISGETGTLGTALVTEDAGAAASNVFRSVKVAGGWTTAISAGLHDSIFESVMIEGATAGINVAGFRTVWRSVTFKNVATPVNNFNLSADLWKSVVDLGAGANPILLADNLQAADGSTERYGIDLHGEATIAINAGATAKPFGATALFSGLLLVNGLTGVNNTPSLYLMAGGGAASTWLVGGDAASYSAAAGTAGRVNVYYNASSEVEIQNNLAGAVSLRVFAVRMRNSP